MMLVSRPPEYASTARLTFRVVFIWFLLPRVVWVFEFREPVSEPSCARGRDRLASDALQALELVERPVEPLERLLDIPGAHVERRDQPHRAFSAAHQQESLRARLLDERP